MSAALSRRLARLRVRLRVARALRGLARLLAAAAAAAGATYLADRALVLPVGTRAALLVTILAGLGFLAHRVLWRPLTRPLPDALLARAVEAVHPGLQADLVSALDFERSLARPDFPESPVLARTVVTRAAERLRTVALAPVARWRRPALELALSLLFAGAVGGALAAPGAYGDIWWRRWFLLAADLGWPRRTELVVLLPPAGSAVYVTRAGGRTVFHVPQGLDFTVHVVALRGDPPEVRLHYAPLGGEAAGEGGVRLLPRVQPGRYAVTFPRLARGFAFYVTGGDDQDREPRYAVEVHEAPAVAGLEVTVHPPLYTRRPVRRVAGGDVEVPLESRLVLELRATQPLREAILLRHGLPPLVMERRGPMRFTGGFTATGDLEYGFALKGENHLENVGELVFRVTVVPDRAPRVTWLRPRGGIVRVAPQGVLPLLATVKDDYGVTAVALRLRARGEDRVLTLGAEHRFGGDDADVAAVREFYVYRQVAVADLLGGKNAPPPKPGDLLRLVLEATDNRRDGEARPRPQTGQSREIRVEVASPADLERRVNDRQLQLKDSVRRARAHQERALADAGALLRRLAGEDPPDPETAAEELLEVERRQYRLTSALGTILAEAGASLDVYVYNRLEASPVTARILALYAAATRQRPEDERERLRRVAAAEEAGGLGPSDVLGKLVRIAALALAAAERTSPAAARWLGEARAAGTVAARRERLGEAVARQQEVLAQLAALAQSLEEWEDYQEVIQLNKELIELEKQILGRTIGLIRRTTGGK